MTLTVELPAGCTQERLWIVDTLLSEFLGVPHIIEHVEGDQIRISHGLKSLIMPDTFFQQAQHRWGDLESCVMNTKRYFCTELLPASTITVSSEVPILFGEGAYHCGVDEIQLPIDVFGTAFVLMSRYEEFVDPRRDDHDRYSSRFSQIGAPELLERPIVNEYVEIVWTCLRELFPNLSRKVREGGVFASADVDIPYSPGNKSLLRLVRRVGGDLIRRRSLFDAMRTFSSYAATKFGHYGLDPYYPWLEWLMSVNEAAGCQMTLFFIADHSAGDIDGVYTLDEPVIKSLMARALTGGHEIGLHPSYGTFCDPVQMHKERELLTNALRQMNCDSEVLECRQHFLRWSVRETASHQVEAGLSIDSTLGYADAAGFRAGVCYEYDMYDLQHRTRIELRQRPLIAMEVSLFGTDYMNVQNHEAALDILLRLKHNCLHFNGDFRMLWHNNMLRTQADRAVYTRVISGRE
jgi:hypothetical protein